MKIRYILGRSGVGKTQSVYEEIKNKLNQADKNKLILLVPEQFTLEGEADLISKMNLDGIMRLEVLSFSRIAYSILNEVGGIKKTTIENIGKLMILRKLFEENLNELQVFKKGFNQDGFLENFCELISEFKKNSVSTEELETRIDLLEKDNMLKRKLTDINLIYKSFNEYLEGRYSDVDDKMNLAIEKLEQSRYFEGAEVWIDGFNTFSAQEYKMLEKLFLKSKSINISLTIDPREGSNDYDLFDPTRDTYRRIKEIAQKNNIKEETIEIKRVFNNKNKELLHLESQFFSYPYDKYKEKTEHISMFSANDQYTEIENLAIEIINLVRDKQYRWRDISVVSNTLDIYNPIIKRVFNEYEIPHFLDEKRSIMNNSIIKFVLSSLEVIARNFRYEDVFKNIKTGLTNINKNDYEILENYCLEKGIRGDTWLKDFEYIDFLDENKEIEETKDIEQSVLDEKAKQKEVRAKRLTQLNHIRANYIGPIKKLKDKVGKKATVRDITTYLFEFLTEVELETKINSLIKEQSLRNNLDYVNENTQIWNTIMQVFDQLVEILGDKSISIKEYTKILESGLGNFEIGIIPPTMDQILVGNLERSKSHDIKALFVIGVNDGLLPSAFNESGIILDDEKLIMKQSGIELYSDNDTKVKEEKLSVYQAMTKPSEYLFISYALGDKEGKSLRPSTFIDRFKKVFDMEATSDLIKSHDNSLKTISTPNATFKYLTENLRNKLDEQDIFEEWLDVYDWYFNKKEWKEKIDLIISGLFHYNQEANISKPHARKLYNVPFRSNISSLETFVNCPFSYFIKKGLRPKERKEYTVNMPDIGTLFHDSIETFSHYLKDEKLSWNEISREKSDELAERSINKTIENFQNGVMTSTHRYEYLIKKLKRVSKRALWVLTEHLKEGEFKPLANELSFGESDEGIPPIILTLKDGTEVILEGRIDRVDVLRDGEVCYLKVIDYKSGNKKFALSDLYHGLQIQLAVYLDAVISNSDKLVKTKAYPAGAFYFKIDDPIVSSNEKDKAAIEEVIHKELKMNGLVLKDLRVVEALDGKLNKEDAESGGISSNIIPVNLNKGGEFSEKSSVFEQEELDGLLSHVRNLIEEVATEILKGKIKIEPIKINKKTSCDYCELSAICQFDTSFKDNQYKSLKKLDNDEVKEEIKSKQNKKVVE